MIRKSLFILGMRNGYKFLGRLSVKQISIRQIAVCRPVTAKLRPENKDLILKLLCFPIRNIGYIKKFLIIMHRYYLDYRFIRNFLH